MPKTVAVIPAFNEAGSIRSVISDLKQRQPSMKILVINGASTDATADEFYHAGETVVTLPFNLDIGGAVQSVLRYAHNYRYDVAVQLESDAQYLVSEIQELVTPIVEHIHHVMEPFLFITRLGLPGFHMAVKPRGSILPV